MKTIRRPRQQGVAAVELAIILCLSLFIFPVVLLFGRVLWSCYVLKQATADAGRLYAQAGPTLLNDTSARAALNQAARQLVVDAIAGAGLRPVPAPSDVDFRCDHCQTMDAADVEVRLFFTLHDQLFNLTWPFMDSSDPSSWTLYAASTVPYANRPLSD